MTEKVIANVSVIEDEAEFFFSLDDGASRVGPFETQEAAVGAASDFLAETFAAAAKAALFGEPK